MRTRALSTIAAALLATTLALPARAQGQLDSDPTALPQTGGQPAQTDDMPETHAAAGAESAAQLPTQAAQLPEDPNKIPKQLKSKLGTDFNPDGYERGRTRETQRSFFGFYYGEESGDYAFRTIFPPLWMEREQGDDHAALYGLSYYRRRSPKVDADVFFPLFWNLRHEDTYTTVFGPVMHRERPEGHDNWLAPIYFEGSGEDGLEYLHIPPLLTFHQRTARSGFTMAGPVYCSWLGGSRCDSRTADEIDYGVAPLYLYGRDADSEYEIIPPLLHYYSYQERGDEELDVWGPLWMERSREGGVFNILPLFWHNWGANRASTTLFPLFHYGYEGTAETIATPLFVNHHAEDGANTFATYLYARHRGRTELDMLTPLLWLYRDPDIDMDRQLLFPFFYREHSPRSDHLVLFPLFGRLKRHNIYTETWITPLFRHRTDLTGWETDIFPLFYMGRENQSTHLVAAPLLFDFASPKDRSTVIFPLFWRFADREGVDQVIGNTYYSEEKVAGGTAWQFHFFPVFSYGETPRGHWWNILYGLAGYTREGTMSKMRTFYIPITLSE